MNDKDGWAGNPVSVYKFTKAYTDEWDEIFTTYQENNQTDGKYPEMVFLRRNLLIFFFTIFCNFSPFFLKKLKFQKIFLKFCHTN